MGGGGGGMGVVSTSAGGWVGVGVRWGLFYLSWGMGGGWWDGGGFYLSWGMVGGGGEMGVVSTSAGGWVVGGGMGVVFTLAGECLGVGWGYHAVGMGGVVVVEWNNDISNS